MTRRELSMVVMKRKTAGHNESGCSHACGLFCLVVTPINSGS
jgi:hypothetical protein